MTSPISALNQITASSREIGSDSFSSFLRPHAMTPSTPLATPEFIARAGPLAGDRQGAVALTPSWQTFDLLSPMPSTASATATTAMAAATTATTSNTSPIPRFDWELF